MKPGETATFTGPVPTPALPGLHELTWTPHHKDKAFGNTVRTSVEVTCSDGVFCNGEERFSNGRCVSSRPGL